MKQNANVHPDHNGLALLNNPQDVGYPNPRNDSEQVRSLHYYVRLLRRQWWKIAMAVTAVTAGATVTAFKLTPQYESTARIAIDMKIPSTVLGEMNPAGNTVTEADQIFNTEIQLIQSDSVVRRVAQDFDIPLPKAASAKSAPVDPKEAPIALPALSVSRVPSSFLLNVSYRAKDPHQAAAIANAIARSYIDHGRETRSRSSMEDAAFLETQIDQLKKNMEDSALALAGYEQKLGLINSEEKTSMLSARLLQLNTEYTDAENDRIRKESAYRSLLSGSDAAIEISPQATDLAHLASTLREDQQKMAKLRTIYGSNNAEYKQAANDLAEVTRQYSVLRTEIGHRIETDFRQALNREQMLSTALKQGKSNSDALSANSAEYQQLKREAVTNRTLYDELFRKVREAGINGNFHSSTVRIADIARPSLRPAFPNKPALILGGFLGSFVLSILTVLISDMFDQSFRDADQAANSLDAEMLGILPYVRELNRSSKRVPSPGTATVALASRESGPEPPSFYKDSIATILNAVIMATRDRPMRSLLITSSVPNEGKSTCVMHMAKVFAQQGMRTLVIDADLRKPSQGQYFNLASGPGMLQIIEQHLPLAEAVRRIEGYEHLHVVTAVPAYDLVHRVGRQVKRLLGEAAGNYDMVFIDAPPVICFAETIQMACFADGVIVIGQAGRTDQRAVRSAIMTLRRIHAHLLGVILNGVKAQDSADYAYENSAYPSRPLIQGAQLQPAQSS
jgi:capsular exopolysaccharide synthesis family protein